MLGTYAGMPIAGVTAYKALKAKFRRNIVGSCEPDTIVLEDTDTTDHYLYAFNDTTAGRESIAKLIDGIMGKRVKTLLSCRIQVPTPSARVVVIKCSLESAHGQSVHQLLKQLSKLHRAIETYVQYSHNYALQIAAIASAPIVPVLAVAATV